MTYVINMIYDVSSSATPSFATITITDGGVALI